MRMYLAAQIVEPVRLGEHRILADDGGAEAVEEGGEVRVGALHADEDVAADAGAGGGEGGGDEEGLVVAVHVTRGEAARCVSESGRRGRAFAPPGGGMMGAVVPHII